MKILMLGWEYPPHISGGLGTACEGLTTALARRGVDIDFMVPRLYGEENAPHMHLLGAALAAFWDTAPTQEPAESMRRVADLLATEPTLSSDAILTAAVEAAKAAQARIRIDTDKT